MENSPTASHQKSYNQLCLVELGKKKIKNRFLLFLNFENKIFKAKCIEFLKKIKINFTWKQFLKEQLSYRFLKAKFLKTKLFWENAYHTREKADKKLSLGVIW